ncbi:retrovirus-related pol polyprotein from transposon TNT 1-94 [Tanacetum coccineum]
MEQKLENLVILALDVSGKNYLSWRLEAETYLDAHGLGDTIQPIKETTSMQKAKALILKALYEWTHLRLQDFKSVSEYNSAMHRITSTLLLCGDTITDAEMLEKTFSTFHASNILLQQQYRAKGFTKYCDLISCLLVAEQNNELLMKNHETRPTGTAPLSEANATTYDDHNRGRGRGYDRGRGRGRGHGFGRGFGRGRSFGRGRGHSRGRGFGRGDFQGVNHAQFKNTVDLYQKSIKNKGSGAEANFVHDNEAYDSLNDPKDPTDATHLDVLVFLFLVKIDVQEGQPHIGNESNARLKRGRPVGSKDKNPRKKKGANIQDSITEVRETSGSPKGTLDMLVQEEPQECRYRNDCQKWKDAIEAELKSLEKRKVFGPIVQTPKGVKPVGYKWVFVRKRNEKNEITRYKARLVAQGFSQRPGIDYEETYSPVVDATTLRYLIIWVKQEGIDIAFNGCMYVDDLNIIGTPGELPKAIECLKREFEMKDLGKTKFCLGLQIKHLKDGILVHQETYTKKLLKRFYMDKSHSLSTPMVVRILDVKKDPFRPRDVDEEILGPEVPYLSAIGALMFLAGHTRPDIAFSLNLLARFSSCPTRRHWNGVKQIFRYLQDLKLGIGILQIEGTAIHGGRKANNSGKLHPTMQNFGNPRKRPLPPSLSLPSTKLMIMALEEYGYQSRRGIRVPKKWRSSYSSDVILKKKSYESFRDEWRGFKMFDLDDFVKMFDDIMINGCCNTPKLGHSGI